MSSKQTKKPSDPGGALKTKARQKRLEAQLKANLQKRKMQARARGNGAGS